MADSISIFTTVLTIMLCIGIITPILNQGFSQPDGSSDISTLNIDGNHSGMVAWLSILINVVTCLFWTFGLPSFFNYILIIPRIVGFASLYYIVFPTK